MMIRDWFRRHDFVVRGPAVRASVQSKNVPYSSGSNAAMILSWFRRSPRQRPQLRHGVRPRLEALEERSLLATAALDMSFNNIGIVSTSFGPLMDTARQMAVQPDGKILVAGETITGGTGARPDSRVALARYLPDGRLDPAFGQGGRATFAIGSKVTGVRNLVLQ